MATAAPTSHRGLACSPRFRRSLRRRPEAELALDAPVEPEAIAVAEPDPTPEEPDPEPVAESPPEPEQSRLAGEDALVAALDSLGMAHHRPYSRA